VRVQLLGPLSVEVDGHELNFRGRRQRSVLGLLAVRANSWVHRDVVIEELWWDDPPPTARNSVHRFVSDLRRALGSDRDRIESSDASYRLRLEPGELDRDEVEAAIGAGRRARDEGEPREMSVRLRSALSAWRGPTLADISDVPSVDVERARLDELRLSALEDLLEVELQIGSEGIWLADFGSVVHEHPFRERLWSLAMTALYRVGRQADAIAAYRELRTNLVDELGLEPAVWVQELHHQILNHAPELAGSRAIEVERASPLDRYELGDVVAMRPEATVRRASVEAVGREVAVMTVDRQLADTPGFIRRFDDELHRVASVDHPNLVSILDGWRDSSGAVVVTEPHPGSTLVEADHLDDHQRTAILRDVGEALKALHDVGLAHGNVRPDLVWLDENGSGVTARLFPAAFDSPCAGDHVDVEGFVRLAGGLGLLRSSHPEEPGAIADVLAWIGDDSPSDRQISNPYKGLRAFDEVDSDDFHGRADVVDRIVGSVRDNRVVTVVGPSGSGKSSVVRAGLLPRLRTGAIPGSERWFVATMIPGSAPFEQLARALDAIAVAAPPDLATQMAADENGILFALDAIVPGSDEIVLVIDQFEELFTQPISERVRTRFLRALGRALVAPSSRLRIVSTIRADFFDRPLASPELGKLVEKGAVPVGPLAPGGLERAIAAPSERAGVDFEPGLSAQIAAEVGGQPATLPLLQHALWELFASRSGSTITGADFERIGGALGALARRAETTYESFGDDERAVARGVLLQLVELGEAGIPTRRRVPRDELDSAGADGVVAEVVDELGRHRLVTFDRDPSTREPTVEVAHEALLTEWERVRSWIDQSRDDLLVQRRLAASATEWLGNDTDESFLAAGTQLEQFEHCVQTSNLAFTDQENEFVTASVDRRDRVEREEAERTGREVELEARSIRRLRWTVVVLAIGVVTAVVLTAVAVGRGREASDRRAEAEEAALESTRQRLVASADAEISSDPQRALLLALEAAKITDLATEPPPADLTDVLHEALAADRLVGTIDGVVAARYLPDGRILVAGTDGRLRVVDENGSVLVESRSAHDGAISDLDVSLDGAVAVTVGLAGDARVWDVETGLLRFALPAEVTSARIRPDGALLLTGAESGLLQLWDLSTGHEIATRPGASAGGGIDLVYAWTSDDDVLFLAVGAAGTALVRLDGTTLETISEPLAEFFGPSCEMAVSSETGAVVAGRPALPSIVVLDPRGEAGGDVALGSIGTGLSGCAADARGDLFALGGEDSVVRVGFLSGTVLFELRGHSAAITTVSWSGDGESVISASADGTARVWDVRRDRPSEVAASTIGALGLDARIGHIVWAPDGETVSVSQSGSATLLDVSDDLAERGRVGGLSGVQLTGIGVYGRTDLSPDGSVTALGSTATGDVAIIETATGSVVRALEPDVASDGTESHVMGVGFDSTGRRLVGTTADGAITMWDVTTGDVISSSTSTSTGPFIEALFTRDDRAFVIVGISGVIETHDVTTGAVLASFDHDGPVIDAVVDDSGDILLTAGVDGVIRVWDPVTGNELRSWSTSSSLTSLALTADGERLFAGSTDGVVTEWDVISGGLRSTPARFEGRIAIGVSPDGSRLLVTTVDGAQLLTTDATELAAIAESRVSRTLTADECRRFLAELECPV